MITTSTVHTAAIRIRNLRSGTNRHARQRSGRSVLSVAPGSILQFLRVSHHTPFNSRNKGYKTHVEDVAGNGPGRFRSPRHRMAFTSSNKGDKLIFRTWRAMSLADIAPMGCTRGWR
jgi:hypothetical protein